ncbi:MULTISPECIES: type II toxin-antitoxin system VapC family toxin [unclassified Gordonia (in: high G+C Gram-positive bacteria)]|uniref:type II toxin-antitoxin system VapC family toxin n=1 Tax=unclassified Gordonia (in: high G+C Gram-positive bacteria) TaxID=2657482 RepID=UPI001F0DBE64|nr:type II toxin-antitoxin system VapC family toxin [Gordonia sp. ABSL49_1]MCH5643808.1 type II toxin-antitoxin system VapC family toxin [Gordonia sp. ABSL49_1]
MIVDTSAVMAVVFDEEDAETYAAALALGGLRMSAGTYLECCIVMDQRGTPQTSREFDAWFADIGVQVEPTSVAEIGIGRQAYRDFGRGSGHPAKLNFGDCFSYALAIHRNESLLWKGDDFSHTGVRSALDEIYEHGEEYRAPKS